MYSILIVDDSKNDREGIRNSINWNSMSISSINLAEDGMEGYEKAIQLKPDFIISDISMPIMNGLDMARKIVEVMPETKIIFVSCFDDFKYTQSAIDINVSAYILKPIKIEELNEALKKVIQEKENEINYDNLQNELKNQLTESMPLLQEKFIADLLHGVIKDENEIYKRGGYLKIQFKRFFSVISILIDNFESNFQDADVEQKYLITYKVKKIIEDEVLNKIDGHITMKNYGNLNLILFLDSEDAEDALSYVFETLTLCKNSINDVLNIQASIGIGGISNNLLDASKMFQGAEYATRSKFYSKGNKIFMSYEVVNPERTLNYDLQELKNQLDIIMESGDKYEVLSFIDQYYDEDKRYSEGQIKGFCFSVINILQLILLDKNESFKSIFDNEMVIWEKLSAFETIVDITQWMFNILYMVRNFLESRENSRFKKVVEDIKHIVDENYNSIENINQVVEGLYISTGYANRVFKQCTGETIFEYLIMKRIEVAKQLLTETNDKIYEVSEKVGYTSKTYFTTIFKEYVGVLPKDYRNRNIKV